MREQNREPMSGAAASMDGGAGSRATCPNGHEVPSASARCMRCEDAAAARREIELAGKYPSEWNELEAAEDSLMHAPRGSSRRRHAQQRVERARARWRVVEEQWDQEKRGTR
jgi:hypothetical protein